MRRKAFKISTHRLQLREFQAEDAAALFRLNSDPEVLRYTGDKPFVDISDASRFIDNYDHYAAHGFGRWAVLDRQTGQFMGFCGLRRRAETAEVDLGFRLFRRYWAAGFATEASQACLDAGFMDFGLEEITGRAMRENLPSISVLQKLGMVYRNMSEENGLFWLIYAITAEDYKSAQA